MYEMLILKTKYCKHCTFSLVNSTLGEYGISLLEWFKRRVPQKLFESSMLHHLKRIFFYA